MNNNARPHLPGLGRASGVVLAVFLGLLSNLHAARTVYWSEDFEGDTSGWSVDAGVWEIGARDTPNGTQVAGTDLDGEYPANSDTRLISPEIVIPAESENPTLRFLQWFALGSGDWGGVEVRPQGGPWTAAPDFKHATIKSGTWTETAVDLSPWAGQTIQIGFRFVSDLNFFDQGWAIDRLQIVVGSLTPAFPQTFENGLGDWFASAGLWNLYEGGSCEGTHAIGTVEPGFYPELANALLVSPTFTVPALGENPRIRFCEWFALERGDYGTVEVRRAGETSGTEVAARLFNSGGVWAQREINLAPWAGEEVQLSFRFVSDFNDVDQGWYLDDIRLLTGPFEAAFPQDFENGLGAWWIEGGLWERGNSGACEGSWSIGTLYNDIYPPNSDGKLVSPWFEVPPASRNPSLEFCSWFENASGDFGQVELQTVGGGWTAISPQLLGDGSIWTTTNASLNAYGGQRVRVRFRFRSDLNFAERGWFLDSIDLVQDPLNSYTLTVENSDPDCGTVTGGGLFQEGVCAPIIATPVEGCAFVRWNGDGIDNPFAAQTCVLIDANKTVTAVFADNFEAWIEGCFPGETDLAIVGRDADPDEDGLTNWEEFELQTIPCDDDTDDDGFKDGFERDNGYDPRNPSDPPAFDVHKAIEVEFATLAGKVYEIQGSADGQSWEAVETIDRSGEGDGPAKIESRFFPTRFAPLKIYRVVEP